MRILSYSQPEGNNGLCSTTHISATSTHAYFIFNAFNALFFCLCYSLVSWLLPLAPRDDGCRDALTKFLCGRFFPECDRTQRLLIPTPIGTFQLPIVLPRLPCRSICHNYARTCDPMLKYMSTASQLPSTDSRAAIFFACFAQNLAANCTSQLLSPPLRNCDGKLKTLDWTIFPLCQPALVPTISLRCATLSMTRPYVRVVICVL